MSTRLPYLKLGMDQQLSATDDQRGVLTVELGLTGAADALVVTLRDATGAYSRQVLFPLNPNPELNSLIVDGLIRWGGVNGTPTINYEAGAGTGPSNKTWTGGDYCGHLTFKTGTGPTTGAQISFVFQNALGNANYRPSAFSFGSNGATVQPYISAQSSTGWTLAFAVAPAASTTYQFEIGVAGR